MVSKLSNESSKQNFCTKFDSLKQQHVQKNLWTTQVGIVSLMIQGALFYAVGTANSNPVFFKFKYSCRQVRTDSASFLSGFEPLQEHSCDMSCGSTFPASPSTLSALRVTISRIVPTFESSIERLNLRFLTRLKMFRFSTL